MSTEATISPWTALADKHIVVVGLGKTGLSVTTYLTEQNARVTCWDTRSAVHNEALLTVPDTAEMILGPQDDAFWNCVDGVVLSPGVAPDSAALTSVHKHHIPVIGDIELFAYAISQMAKPPKLVGITGSNGKTTCTLLLTHLLNSAGIKAECAGNVGTPALDCLKLELDVLVLELSSFQLELTHSLHLDVACFLNLSDDHLDRHGTMDNYAAIKQRIYTHAERAVFWREQAVTAPTVSIGQCQSFGLSRPNRDHDWSIIDSALCQGDKPILALSDIPMAGLHNVMNVMACCAMASMLGTELDKLKPGICSFAPPPHRCVTISNFNDAQWVDDSKATNAGATIAALEGLGSLIKGRLFLIAGGDSKGADLSVLEQAFTRYVYKLFAIGKDARAIADLHTNSQLADTLEAAVSQISKECGPNDIVLLSPACASWDMFDNYQHRAQVFAQAVERLNA